MFVRWAVLLLLLAAALPYFLEYRDWTDWTKKNVLRVAPGPCKTIIDRGGSEDILPIGNNKFLITQGFNLASIPGRFLLLDLNTDTVENVTITNTPQRKDFLAALHGITSWTDSDTGELFVYAVTHATDEDRIEVFEVSPTLTFTYVKTITDPSFTYMNDLVAVGRHKFYITSSFRYRGLRYMISSMWLRLRTGTIVYYDGHKGREVASGYVIANGINVSPDMGTIYMAESGGKKVHAFRRDEVNNLHPLWEHEIGTMVDNIYVEPASGNLWIGSQPIAWRILDFFRWFGGVKPASQILRVKLRDNHVTQIEEIYSDDGDEISGSTIAVYVNGRLIIGSVVSKTLICDVKYLSP